MTSVAFAYWLQGFFELAKPTELNAEQVALIQKHLHLVFEHEIDPSYPDAEKLKEIHAPETPAMVEGVCSEPDGNKKLIPPTHPVRQPGYWSPARGNFTPPRIMC